MYDTPHIHLMRTPLNHYFFEVNRNEFVQVSREAFEELRRLTSTSKVKTQELSEELVSLKARGYLSTKRPKEIKHPQSDFLACHLEHNMKGVILQLTQQCNFRCAYCPYTPKDFDYQRVHTSNRMSFETAKRVIDFYVAHSTNQDSGFVGLYGGEPLLEFELFKKIVAYAEYAFEGKDIYFSTTTNGSLLTDEVVDFLGSHNFDFIISLDGTAEIHDRSRKFADNGKGTFSAIQRNIERANIRNPKLLKEAIINVVVDPRYSCDPLHKLFTLDPLFKKIQVQTGLIDDTYEIERVIPTEQYNIEAEVHDFKAYMAKLNRYPEEKVSRVARVGLDKRLHLFGESLTPITSLSDSMSPGGPCIPGEQRLFVDYQGRFFPCEKVSETSDAMQIGDIDHGFDLEKAQKLLNVGKLTEEECKDCWAIYSCGSCAKKCDNMGELSKEIRLSNCYVNKRNIEDFFRTYLMLKELENA